MSKYLFLHGHCLFLNGYGCQSTCSGSYSIKSCTNGLWTNQYHEKKKKDNPCTKTGKSPYQFGYLGVYRAAPDTSWQFADLCNNTNHSLLAHNASLELLLLAWEMALSNYDVNSMLLFIGALKKLGNVLLLNKHCTLAL